MVGRKRSGSPGQDVGHRLHGHFLTGSLYPTSFHFLECLDAPKIASSVGDCTFHIPAYEGQSTATFIPGLDGVSKAPGPFLLNDAQ